MARRNSNSNLKEKSPREQAFFLLARAGISDPDLPDEAELDDGHYSTLRELASVFLGLKLKRPIKGPFTISYLIKQL